MWYSDSEIRHSIKKISRLRLPVHRDFKNITIASKCIYLNQHITVLTMWGSNVAPHYIFKLKKVTFLVNKWLWSLFTLNNFTKQLVHKHSHSMTFKFCPLCSVCYVINVFINFKSHSCWLIWNKLNRTQVPCASLANLYTSRHIKYGVGNHSHEKS